MPTWLGLWEWRCIWWPTRTEIIWLLPTLQAHFQPSLPSLLLSLQSLPWDTNPSPPPQGTRACCSLQIFPFLILPTWLLPIICQAKFHSLRDASVATLEVPVTCTSTITIKTSCGLLVVHLAHCLLFPTLMAESPLRFPEGLPSVWHITVVCSLVWLQEQKSHLLRSFTLAPWPPTSLGLSFPSVQWQHLLYPSTRQHQSNKGNVARFR